MTVTTNPIKSSKRKREESKANPSQDKGNAKMSLKDLEVKVHPFLDSDVSGMLNELLQLKLIKLSPSKSPEEMGREHDPKYCCYHCVVSHLIENALS